MRNQAIFFNKIIIIGLGLIGGSIALACRKNNLCNILSAYDSDSEQLRFAINNNIINQTYKFGNKIEADDLLIIAAPLAQYNNIVHKIFPALHKNTIIIDVGSLKFFVEKDILPLFANHAKNFIPCHPIAGSEKSGIRNSDGELFLGKKVIITKSSTSSISGIEKINLFWNEIGSEVQFLTAKKHDKIYALVSHFPQFLSYMATDGRIKTDNEILKKHLRLENSNNKIWQDVFRLNRDNIEHYANSYLQNLELIIDKLEKKEYSEIILFLENVSESISKFGLVHKKIPALNHSLILERVVLTSCFAALPDIIDFKNYSGSGFKDFILILSYLKNFLHDKKQASHMLTDSQELLIKQLVSIRSKIKNYEFN